MRPTATILPRKLMVRSTCLLLLVSILFFNRCFAQQANIWYFGQNAGLDFNSGAPVPLTDGQLVTQEGCASIADNNGNLLFYTDGINVWNRNHQIMPNGMGLMGNNSATQSAIIVPDPGNPTSYYIFTVDCYENNLTNGLRYSVVDMNLQAGLGDVTAVKNVLLIAPTCEKVTAVLNQNNHDIWVVTHQYGNDAFYAYLVTNAGVSTTPVISNVGVPITNTIDAIGYMKASSDGHRLVCAIDFEDYLEIYDFDNSNGVVSNPLTSPNNYNAVYGVEFSPDSKRLYWASESQNLIYQIDLTAGSAAAIFASNTIVGTSVNNTQGALQLAPDGKIYICRYMENWLGVINDPNTLGVGCNWADNGVNLQSGFARIGLPDFIQSYFYTENITFINTCFGDSTFFTLSDTLGLDSVFWNFGDPASGAANTSTQIYPSHIFSSSGSFTVTLYSFFSGYTDTSTAVVTILDYPNADLGNDTTICASAFLQLNAGNPGDTYLWQDGSTADSFVATSTGDYYVNVSNACGSDADTIHVVFSTQPQVDLVDSVLCDGETYLLDATNGGATYQWQDGSSGATFNATGSGIYWVAVSIPGCGTASDTATVKFLAIGPPDLGPDTLMCRGKTLALHGDMPDVAYLWSDGTTGNEMTVNQEGIYSLNVSNKCGTFTDSINVTYTDCELCIYLPTAFSPNQDGVNDLFHPVDWCPVTSYEMQIYNRWGQLIFDTNEITAGWDGTYQSEPCEVGVYVYVLKYGRNINGAFADEVAKGNVTLVR